MSQEWAHSRLRESMKFEMKKWRTLRMALIFDKIEYWKAKLSHFKDLSYSFWFCRVCCAEKYNHFVSSQSQHQQSLFQPSL